MIRGRNFQGARVQVIGPGLRVVGAPKINERGTYIFVDVFIAPNAQPGERSISVTTPRGSARASFEVLGPLNRAGRFQGFSPADVMYLIMIDRFADGDPSNNDPPQSRGHLRSEEQVLLSRRRSSGRDRSLALPERARRHRDLADALVRQLRSPQPDRAEGRQTEHRISRLQSTGFLLPSRNTSVRTRRCVSLWKPRIAPA